MKPTSKRSSLAGLAALAILSGGATGFASAPLYAAPAAAVAPAITVTGTVTDAQGEPLIGATVLVKGTTLGTSTDLDGKFTLKNVTGKTLVISYVGYRTKEVPVSKAGDIVLEEDSSVLDELVVVGYGVQKKGSLTGAVSAVGEATFR